MHGQPHTQRRMTLRESARHAKDIARRASTVTRPLARGNRPRTGDPYRLGTLLGSGPASPTRGPQVSPRRRA
jgi:hypothetical protein